MNRMAYRRTFSQMSDEAFTVETSQTFGYARVLKSDWATIEVHASGDWAETTDAGRAGKWFDLTFTAVRNADGTWTSPDFYAAFPQFADRDLKMTAMLERILITTVAARN